MSNIKLWVFAFVSHKINIGYEYVLWGHLKYYFYYFFHQVTNIAFGVTRGYEY